MTSERPTIQPDDLLQLKFLHSGELSPDGSQVLYAYVFYDPQAEKEQAIIRLRDRRSGQTRSLTAGRSRDTHPRFSPDGRSIAFLSDREGKPQIYVMPVDGGEPRPVTQLKQGVGSGPVWSPDGHRIAFTAGPAEPPLDLEKPYRVTRPVYRFDMLGYLDNAVHDIYVVAQDERGKWGEPQRLTGDGCHNSGPAWSPDGSALLYQATMFPDELVVVLPRLRTVTLAGAIQEVTGDWGHSVSAVWHPDGQRILFIGGPQGRPIGSKSDLWVVPAAGGEPECRTAGFVPGVGGRLQADMPTLREILVSPRILLDEAGQRAFVQAQVGGTVQILAVSLTGPEAWQPILSGERSCFPLDRKGAHLLYGVSTVNNPGDLFLIGLDGEGEEPITALNRDFLAGKALPRWEHMPFTGQDGAPVEGWMLLPAVGDAPHPTVLYIHGGPHSGFGHIYSFDFQMLAGAGYGVLFINQRGSTGYGDAFATQILGDWGNLDYTDLMAGVDEAIRRGWADEDRLGCCGLSGGGNLSCWIVGQTDRFKAAAPENPVTNWVSFYGVSDIGPWFAVEELGGAPWEIPEVYRRCSPITYAHRCTTPTLLIQGEADYRCPAEQSEQFYAVLKANGCTVEMVRLPSSPHGGSIAGPVEVRQAQNDALLGWMNRYVLGKEGA